MMSKRSVFCLAVLMFAPVVMASICEDTVTGRKNIYWGDFHVHTAYSLDAYSFGTMQNPAEAYEFARGKPMIMADGKRVQLDRPLDFTAVTDHSEWFDFLYLCTDPGMSEHPDCKNVRDHASPTGGLGLFRQYVVPSITYVEPQILGPCVDNAENCRKAYVTQWDRVQAQANAANEPCEFTSFVGYEWSATRNFRHTHRNVIFANENVPGEAFDYIRYPKLDQLFKLLDEHCKLADGCDVITIPHNTNMGDGTTFDVEQESERQLSLRSRFERLVEIHQEKGNSECLAPLGVTDESDCNFETRLTKLSSPATQEDYNSDEWEHMRATYVRGLLMRGLAAYRRSGSGANNPLQLGIIGSTDGHAATPGFVEESAWNGPVFGIGSFDKAMARRDWNPGGLVAIRAEENTRESLFAAMKRREVYATSGPRIGLDFESDVSSLSCEAGGRPAAVTMGGDFSRGQPYFRLNVASDRVPLQQIEVVKGKLQDGIFRETVVTLWEGSATSQCIVWQDSEFVEEEPAFWYARVKEEATARWSAHHCRAKDRCDEFPGADVMIQERAWSSPIWYLPIKE
jgi:hypothetical protein